MRVVFISFFNRWITHLGTELELAQLHLDRGDSVSFLGCDGSIGACVLNAEGTKRICDECRLRRAAGIHMLRPPVAAYRMADYLPRDLSSVEQCIASEITDAESARSFRYRGHDLGWGALSSTIMKLRDPVCDCDEARTLLQRFAKAAVRSYLGVEAFLQAHPRFDTAYIFNGRFACTRGALRACQTVGISNISIHERGSSAAKYQLFHNTFPHDRIWWQTHIDRQWETAPAELDREAIGRSYFENRRRGTPADWKSFVTAQEAGLLPDNWDGSKTNIGIFTSSEDEFTGIGDSWRNPLYRVQSEGIERLVRDAGSRYPHVHFHVRMHPNLTGITNSEVAKVYGIRSPNCTVIEPSSTVSTYALLDAVDRAVTFGSTVGIEATYWGKISLLAGPALYEHMNVAYVAQSHEDLLRLIDADLKPKPVDDVLKYGFCMQTFGVPFEYWEPEGFEDGRFRGRPLAWSSRTRLEREILIGCLNAGVHSLPVHDAVSGMARLGSNAWRTLTDFVQRTHG